MSSAALVVAAAGLASGAAWACAPPPADARRRLGLSVDEASARSGRHLLIVTGAIGAGLWLVRPAVGAVTVLALGGAGVGWAVHKLIGNWRDRRVRQQRRVAVVELCDALTAELEAGLPAPTAMKRACLTWPELSDIASRATLGDDVVAALRQRAAASPGAEGLRSVAAAWEVAGRSGAALAVVLGRVAAGLRSDEAARAEVTAALGPPRATAKMLAVLPLFGVALGASMGADPIGFLLGSGAGLVCLAVGTALALAGVWWVEQLASAAEG
jgi:tight adherence protein B